MQILLVVDTQKTLDYWVGYLSRANQCRLDWVNSLEDAQEWIFPSVSQTARPRTVDLLVWEHPPDDSDSVDIESFLQKLPQKAILLCQEGPHWPSRIRASKSNYFFDEQEEAQGLIALIETLIAEGKIDLGPIASLDHEGGAPVEFRKQALVKVRTQLLLAMIPLNSDIFVRLSETKFVRMFRQGDIFDVEDLRRYTIDKKLEFLYIRSDRTDVFVNKLSKVFLNEVTAPPRPLTQTVQLQVRGLETVNELFRGIGFTPEVQGLIRTQVSMTVRSMSSESTALKDILAAVAKNQGQYGPAHSVLASYIACAMASQCSWGSKATYTKLTLAAFLHDLSLEKDWIAQIQTLKELEEHREQMTLVEYDSYKAHPLAAAELARTMKEIPPDVDVILHEHHERPGGEGFPRGLLAQAIAPLSAVFILAHELTHFYVLKPPQTSLQDFLAKLKAEYTSSQFRKLLTQFEIAIAQSEL